MLFKQLADCQQLTVKAAMQTATQLCHSLTHMMDYTVLWILLTKKVSQRWSLWINKMKQYFFSPVVGCLHRATLHPIIVIALPLTHSISKSLIKSHQHTETWLRNALHVVHEMLMQTQNIMTYWNNWALIPKNRTLLAMLIAQMYDIPQIN